MNKLMLGTSTLEAPVIAVGCMRVADMETAQLSKHLTYCVENGLNFFDHADIYGRGRSELNFSKALEATDIKREDIIIQSKCAIVPGVMYDFSKEHILEAVDGSLKRLNTEYLDVLLLHRPDALMEPEEVAEAFDILESSGKVRHFGVSNHTPYQMELLKKCVKQELIINQLQLSLAFAGMISSGIEANTLNDGGINRDGGILDYCRLKDITVQAWSPFQYGFFEGIFVGNNEKFPELNKVLDELAEKYNVTPTGIATAWILRHPAGIQMIAGTTNTSRMGEIIHGSEIKLSREEWYRLYKAAGHKLP